MNAITRPMCALLKKSSHCNDSQACEVILPYVTQTMAPVAPVAATFATEMSYSVGPAAVIVMEGGSEPVYS